MPTSKRDVKLLSTQAQIDRRACQQSLYYLCKEVLGYKDMVPHVHADICHFATDERYGRFRQATVPRSHFKTWVYTIGKSIWLTLPDEDELYKKIFPYKGANCRTLIASNVIDNAAKMVNKIKREWETNARLKAAFPELVPTYNKTRWSDHCAEVNRTIAAQEGTYTAVGVGGSVISQHFDHIIEDDLIYANKDDFTGEELMPNQEDIDNAIGWHKLAFSLLADPQTGCMDNVGTRWAPHDLIDYIRKREPHYACFELASTKRAVWPIPNDSYCIWPERYNKKTLEQIRDSQGPKIFECFPQEAPILMADFSIKPISTVCIGDEVVGFTKGDSKSKLIKSTVNLLERQQREVTKITLDTGEVIRCTLDHPWYVGKVRGSRSAYLPARIGAYLYKVYDIKNITFEDSLDYSYLAGLIDGEGACNHGSIAIGQSKEANPDVYAGIEAVLNRLNIPYKIGKVNPNDTHILRSKEVRRGLGESFVLGEGRQVKGDIIRFGNPAKKHRILNTIWDSPHCPIKGRSKVLSIEPDGFETVYAIGTTSGNYIAYGYATKNTQYLNRPRSGEDVTFDVSYINKHDSIHDYPTGLRPYTFVDLASWKDKKRICNNVVLTGARDANNEIWIHRVDSGKFNPTRVIELMNEHQMQFNSKVMVEEVGYQVAIRHFAHIAMSVPGANVYTPMQIPPDNRKGAKELRINSLEPLVRNGMVHVLSSMKSLVQEMEDYPYGSTKDMLDIIGYLVRHARPSFNSVAITASGKFTLDKILEELESGNSTGLLGQLRKEQYATHIK
jgi:hypothetical protein